MKVAGRVKSYVAALVAGAAGESAAAEKQPELAGVFRYWTPDAWLVRGEKARSSKREIHRRRSLV